MSAQAWARDWLARQGEAPVAILTRGRGAHVMALAEAAPGATVVVLCAAPGAEPLPGARVIEADAPAFRAVAGRLLTHDVATFRADPPEEFIVDGTARTPFDEMIRLAARDAVLERQTRPLTSAWIDNLAANAGVLFDCPSVDRCIGALEGLPVLVAGAGPSLGEALDEIAALRDRFVLLAASSAVRPLLRAGIEPDGVVVIEGRDCSHHLEGVPEAPLRRAVLLAAATTHPAHLAWPFGALALFHGSPSVPVAALTGPASALATAGNVGTAGLALGWLLGGVPVLAAGLDFALGGADYYVDGSGSRADVHDGASHEVVAGWDGTPRLATPELAYYREQTEEFLGVVHEADPRAPFIAITRGGARVAGMAAMRLGQLSAALPRVPPRILQDAVAAAPPARAAAATRRAAFRGDVARIEGAMLRLARDPRGAAAAMAIGGSFDPLGDLLLAQNVSEPEAAVAALRRLAATLEAAIDGAAALRR